MAAAMATLPCVQFSHPTTAAVSSCPAIKSSLRASKPLHFPLICHAPLHLRRSPRFDTKISCCKASSIPDRATTSPIVAWAGKVAVLLVGSSFLLGRHYCGTALAEVPAPRSNLSSPMEEKTNKECDLGETKTGRKKERRAGENLEMFEKVLVSNPNDLEALKVVLYGKMQKGKFPEAAALAERLIALEPQEVEWLLLRALSYELMGDLPMAKKLFKEILEGNPLLIRALHGLALAMHKSSEGPAVFDMLNEALELAKSENRVQEERNIQLLIAQMHVIKGDLDAASKRFHILVKENPRDFRPYLCQGLIYSLLDKKKEADEQFEMYRTLVPDELPHKAFIDGMIRTAKVEGRESLVKEFESGLSYKK